jgi:hypothetical protein
MLIYSILTMLSFQCSVGKIGTRDEGQGTREDTGWFCLSCMGTAGTGRLDAKYGESEVKKTSLS